MSEEYEIDDDDETIEYCSFCDDQCWHVHTVDYSKCLSCGMREYFPYDNPVPPDETLPGFTLNIRW